MKEYRIRGYAMVEVNKIIVVKNFNPRYQFDRGKIDELKQSILAVGIKTPLIIQENGDGTFNLVDGERRFIAITELIAEGHPFVSIPCRIKDKKADKAEALLEAVTANTGIPLTKGEEARAFHRFIHVYGWTLKKLAEMLGKPYSAVYDRVTLWEQSDEVVREALLRGDVSVVDAQSINEEDAPAMSVEEVKERAIKKQEEKKQFKADVWGLLHRMIDTIGENNLTPEEMNTLDTLLKKYKPGKNVKTEASSEQQISEDPAADMFQEDEEEGTL